MITAAVASTALLSGRYLTGHYAASAVVANSAHPSLADHNFAALENSIKANFGSGFEVMAQTLDGDGVVAGIEHLGNHYIVTSSDLLDWQILHSSVS